MSTKYIVVYLAFVLWSNPLLAQVPVDEDTSIAVKIKNLELASAPAFMLLDITPSLMEDSKTPKDVVLSFLNNVKENNGLPKDYAIEVTPYWLLPAPSKAGIYNYAGLQKMNNADTYKYNPFSRAKFVTLSLAYMNTMDNFSFARVNNLAVGGRTTLFKYYKPSQQYAQNANKVIEETRAKLRAVLDSYQKTGDLSSTEWALKKELEKTPPDDARQYAIKKKLFLAQQKKIDETNAAIEMLEAEIEENSSKELIAARDALENKYDELTSNLEYKENKNYLPKWQDVERVKKLKNNIEAATALNVKWKEDFANDPNSVSKLNEVLSTKPFFSMNIAAAYNQVFLDDNFKSNRFGRFGIWSTFVVNPTQKDNGLNLFGIVRYIADNTYLNLNGTNYIEHFVDYGVKVAWTQGPVSVSFETIRRYSVNEKYKRNVGGLKYQINEKYALTGAFGENFENVSGSKLMALFGINFGFLTGNESAPMSPADEKSSSGN